MVGAEGGRQGAGSGRRGGGGGGGGGGGWLVISWHHIGGCSCANLSSQLGGVHRQTYMPTNNDSLV